jgi:hypothetical protein
MKELFIIDRIENGMAACELESREIRMIPLGDLPHGVCEGDCLWHEDGKYTPDPEETQRRRKSNAALLRRLMGRG